MVASDTTVSGGQRQPRLAENWPKSTKTVAAAEGGRRGVERERRDRCGLSLFVFF